MNSTEAQEKINTYNSRKIALKNQAWFRFLQVVYWLAVVFCAGIVLILTFSTGDQGFTIFFWGAIIIAVVFWIIEKVAYYIFLGSIRTIKVDPEQMLDSKLKK